MLKTEEREVIEKFLEWCDHWHYVDYEPQTTFPLVLYNQSIEDAPDQKEILDKYFEM